MVFVKTKLQSLYKIIKLSNFAFEYAKDFSNNLICRCYQLDEFQYSINYFQMSKILKCFNKFLDSQFAGNLFHKF